jgi:hypothetical protein
MILLAITLAAATPEIFKSDSNMTIYGAGSNSCALGFAPKRESETFTWIMGFWSGINAVYGTEGPIRVDGQGIVGEVKKLCIDNPSMMIAEATMKTYIRFSQQD